MEFILWFNLATFILLLLIFSLHVVRSETLDTDLKTGVAFNDALLQDLRENKRDVDEMIRIFKREMDAFHNLVLWRRVFTMAFGTTLCLFLVFLSIELFNGCGLSSCRVLRIPWILVFLVIYLVTYQASSFFSHHRGYFIYKNIIEYVEMIRDSCTPSPSSSPR